MGELSAKELYEGYHPRLTSLGAWPKDLEFSDRSYEDGNYGAKPHRPVFTFEGCWWDGGRRGAEVDDCVAAAILRCAAEDAIFVAGRAKEGGNDPFTVVIMATTDGGFQIRRDHWDWLDVDPTNPEALVSGEGRKVLTPDGETIHHAIWSAIDALLMIRRSDEPIG